MVVPGALSKGLSEKHQQTPKEHSGELFQKERRDSNKKRRSFDISENKESIEQVKGIVGTVSSDGNNNKGDEDENSDGVNQQLDQFVITEEK